MRGPAWPHARRPRARVSTLGRRSRRPSGHVDANRPPVPAVWDRGDRSRSAFASRSPVGVGSCPRHAHGPLRRSCRQREHGAFANCPRPARGRTRRRPSGHADEDGLPVPDVGRASRSAGHRCSRVSEVRRSHAGSPPRARGARHPEQARRHGRAHRTSRSPRRVGHLTGQVARFTSAPMPTRRSHWEQGAGRPGSKPRSARRTKRARRLTRFEGYRPRPLPESPPPTSPSALRSASRRPRLGPCSRYAPTIGLSISFWRQRERV